MRNGKFSKRRGIAAKTMMMILAVMLIVGGTIGGTVAWLTAKTEPVVNTFTVGDINIDLAETTTDYKMVPGSSIGKDPEVTVKAGSEACWLFVKVEKSPNLDHFITYAIAEGWTELEGQTGVYYRQVAAAAVDVTFSVLKDDKVNVNSGVTKTDMEALKADDAIQPTLTFTAYAVQKENMADAAEAWAAINPTPGNP